MAALFAVTLFVSATLLFLVQPMIAKMILPKFGGTPAVWNTCMVFFQALLLAGYSYAHATTAWLGVRKQAALQLGLLMVPALALPLAVDRDPPGEGSPVFWLLYLLLLSVGVPFFAVSTSAPLLQKWFANTGHPSADDPYFLYAASNLGSMLSLVLYPVWLEPTFRLYSQSWIWTAGYAGLVVMTAACAYALWQSPDPDSADYRHHPSSAKQTAPPPSWWTKAHWVVLAFVPSSMMIGVTTYMSTDIAAIPLIWVIPLGLYLLSFILVFAKLPEWIHTFMVLSLPVLVLLQMYLMLSDTSQSMKVLIALHLGTLFVVAMVCHGELARHRPDTRYLTEFYLLMSLGGVLGGMFNALFAPVAFNTVLEYYLVMVVACLVMPPLSFEEKEETETEKAVSEVTGLGKGRMRRLIDWSGNVLPSPGAKTALVLDFVLPLVLGLLTLGLIFRMSVNEQWTLNVLRWMQNLVIKVTSVMNATGSAPELPRLRKAIEFGIPALLCYAFVNRPIRFGLGVGAIMLASGLYAHYYEEGDILMRERSFFGILKLEKTTIYVKLSDASLAELRKENVPEDVLTRLTDNMEKNEFYSEDTFNKVLASALPLEEIEEYGPLIVKSMYRHTYYHRLVHGTTLHGKQRFDPDSREAVRDWYRLSDRALQYLRDQSVSDSVLAKLAPLTDKDFDSEKDYVKELGKLLSPTELESHKDQLLQVARSAEPLTYYHRTGPLGHVFEALRKGKKTAPVALIGLGTGTTSAYGEPGQEVTYYEIDQSVIDIAQNQKYFSYWTDAVNRGVKLNVVLGDARLSLKNDKDEKSPDGHFQLIVVDAFSSDAIPVHLITREAVQLYKQKLAKGGIIAFHISNRYLDLEPVVNNLAEAENLKGIVFHDSKDDVNGKAASTWIMLTEDEADFLSLRAKFMTSAKDEKPWYRFEDDARWHPEERRQRTRPDVGVWTDDFSNILSVFTW